MVAPKLRFEVFKRDDFTCQYCGRKTPTVVLEVDHVVPKTKGGENGMDNLATSCWECNRGKGNGLLPESSQDPPRELTSDEFHDQAVLLLERGRQLAEYNEVRRQVRERMEGELDGLLCYWVQLAGDHPCEPPDKNMLRSYLRDLAAEDIKDAMAEAWTLGGFREATSRFQPILDMRMLIRRDMRA